MKIRVFERDRSLRHLLKLICQWVSTNVEVAESAEACPAYSGLDKQPACCSGARSVLIIDAHLSPLSGLDWVENQARSNCQVLPDNKLILATHWPKAELQRAERLGCHTMCKPFKTRQVLAWIKERVGS